MRACFLLNVYFLVGFWCLVYIRVISRYVKLPTDMNIQMVVECDDFILPVNQVQVEQMK